MVMFFGNWAEDDFRSVNVVLVLRNWLLGKRIAEEELKGEGRAEYGMKLVENLSKSLSEKYGNGFTKRSLYKYLQFYKYFPQIVPSVTAQSSNDLIVPSVTAQLLSWTHYE
ncbi:MAG: DUF1016 N-terminal domain-containing protein, partial [Lachnospiraceae bacterium]|nr:DUF1016 N-terminal domain-containing protein [Lachnospiraceae bacterium]